jgi:hypothetical protein
MDEADTVNSEIVRLVDQRAAAGSHRGLLDPRGPYLRWIAVFFMCFLSFGKNHLFY